MTPERERDIRNRYAGHTCSNPDCLAWQCSLHAVLAELDALRAKVGALNKHIAECRRVSNGIARGGNTAPEIFRSEGEAAAYDEVINHAREIGLFEEASDD